MEITNRINDKVVSILFLLVKFVNSLLFVRYFYVWLFVKNDVKVVDASVETKVGLHPLSKKNLKGIRRAKCI